ncbi:MAG: metal-dependent hydrolase [Moraxellaceae bacterium]|nr:metal-dependent hydrolase [Moraxellaceae bacterium]
MDSVSQFALGAAVGVATMGRRVAPWKAALVGAVCGTLPDLDVVIDYGDPVSNMTLHRTESHALFYLSLVSPALAWLADRLWRQPGAAQGASPGESPGESLFRRWWLAVWLALITHPLLDLMTVYGTQLGLPFTDHPYAVGSMFIIDPLYTLPLLVGLVAVLSLRNARGLRWNAAGLVLSTLYLGWATLAQQHVRGVAEDSLRAQGLDAGRVLVTPTAFNTVLWRVVAMGDDSYREGFYSLLDGGRSIHFDRFPQHDVLRAALPDNPYLSRVVWFSHGFYAMREDDGRVLVSDLRMGQEPTYSFNFVLAQRRGDSLLPLAPEWISRRPDIGRGLAWIWQRAGGEPVPPPRQ